MGKLSGGQRAQVALALILAKRPRLLLLDEPVAALDPLARRNFLGLLADGVAAGGLTVVLSSHLVADLERVCDHLIMLASSRVQLCGDIEDLLAEHQILTGPRKDTTAIEQSQRVVEVTRTPRQTTLLVRLNGPVLDPAFEASEVSLEELVLAYMGQDAEPGPAPSDHGWRREMTWLVWRQHRVQFSVGAALLVALAVLLVITGLQMASQYHSALVACAANHSCANLSSTLFLGSHAVGFLVIMTLGAPILVGLFWGAPMVAAEVEAGTTQFAWMQSVTRRRWLAVKVGWMLLAAAVWGGVISALVTWWSGPNSAEQLNAFDPGRFDLMGLVPVAYSLFALALGIAAGALVRRVLPAIAVTLAGFIAVRTLITLLLRPHYLSAVTVFYKVTSNFPPPGSFWQLASGIVGPNGQAIDLNTNGNVVYGVPANYLPASCTQVSRGAFTPPPSCVQAASHFRGFVTYQPADRYWTFQGIETGIFLVLAAALIAVTAMTLLRRDA